MTDDSPSAVAGLAQLGLTVSDLPRATGFYRDVLGLPPKLEADATAYLGLGDARLMPGRHGGGGTERDAILYFRVHDMDAAVERLRAGGVEFLGEPRALGQIDGREVRGTFFRDPEGRLLALMDERRVD